MHPKIYRSQLSAKARNITWDITDDIALELMRAPCSYCGREPFHQYNRCTELLNGLDRVDSNLGYTQENVVPACKECNQAKFDMSNEQFMDTIRRIYEFKVGGTLIYRKFWTAYVNSHPGEGFNTDQLIQDTGNISLEEFSHAIGWTIEEITALAATEEITNDT